MGGTGTPGEAHCHVRPRRTGAVSFYGRPHIFHRPAVHAVTAPAGRRAGHLLHASTVVTKLRAKETPLVILESLDTSGSTSRSYSADRFIQVT